MKRLLWVSALLLTPSFVSAQDSEAPPETPPCDWSWFYGSPDGITSQPGHNEIAGGWDCHGNQSIVDYIWREMDFTWWTTGLNHGFHDPCNPTFPIGRAITASMLMGYSGIGNPTCDTNDANMLNWALCWAASRYDELSTHCFTDSTAFAKTTISPLGSQTWLWPAGMYEQGVEGLAGTIMHEARHWDCLHNGGSDCGRRRSCDESWADGCPWPDNGDGANRYQIVWLAWYRNSGTRGGDGLKEAAVARANEILAAAFTRTPCFRFDDNGVPMDSHVPGCSND